MLEPVGSREAAVLGNRNEDLHGNVPDKASAALLLIDVINDLEFPEGKQLLRHALPMARSIVALKERARGLGIPAIYVNDNFGRWQSNFHAQIEHCLHDGVIGKPLAELLVPDQDDYFVLKPKHSGFFSTTLDILLKYLQVNSVLITGIAANICVLFTANDAYMRDYRLFVPGDCVASNTEEENRHALGQMSQVLKADTRASVEMDLEAIVR
jgi:nicotinamidase-related amidase